MNKKKYTKWIVIALIASTVVCTVFIIHQENDRQQKQYDIATLSQEIQQREIELRHLEEALSSLEREEEKATQCCATIEPIFLEPDSAVSGTLALEFQKVRSTGVIVLTGNQLPGMEGYMTAEEFRTLLESGWEYCWRYNGEDDLQSWYDGLCSAAQSLGVAVTDSVYFVENSHQPDRDEAFIQLGFKNLIHQGEYENSAQTNLTDEKGVWHIPISAIEINDAGLSVLDHSIKNSDNAVLLLSLRRGDHYISMNDLLYTLSNICSPYIKADQLSICGFSEARMIQAENQKKREMNESPFSEEYLQLQQQIQALNEQLDTLRMRFEKL